MTQVPLPLAGGVRGGPLTSYGNFRTRSAMRARELRGAATPAERKLWAYLSRSGLGVKFSRQMPVGPYFADFPCRERMLSVELDGISHDVQPERDIHRDRILNDAGYRVLHFPNAEVLGNVEGVIMAKQSALAERPTPNPSRRREGLS